MSSKSPHLALVNLVTTNVPSGFLRDLRSDIGFAYREAHEVCSNEPSFGAFEAEYVYPHYRRAIIERLFRVRAAEFGLPVDVEQLSPAKGNSYSRVRAGRIVLSCHHVDWMTKKTRNTQYKRFNTDLNVMLCSPTLGALDGLFLDSGQPLYAQVIHTTDRENLHALGQIELSFSDPEGGSVEISVNEIIERQQVGVDEWIEDDDLDIHRREDRQEGTGIE